MNDKQPVCPLKVILTLKRYSFRYFFFINSLWFLYTLLFILNVYKPLKMKKSIVKMSNNFNFIDS